MLFIIIPVFNRLNYTINCLKSLREQSYNNFKTILVDHGSTDSTSEIISQQFPEVLIVLGTSDLWWTGATNLGIQKTLEISSSDEDLILTLNNDLEVDSDYLQNIINIHDQNKPCLVGSVSVDIRNTSNIVFAGTLWNSYSARFTPLIKQLTNDPDNEVIKTDLLPGRGTLIPISAFKQIGLFDQERFPHYAADEDYSLQCRKHGYKLLVASKAVVKSHTDSTGISTKYQKLSIKAFINSLNSIKSPVNIKTRYNWARKNASVPLLYFAIDYFRIIGSYIRSLIKNTIIPVNN